MTSPPPSGPPPWGPPPSGPPPPPQTPPPQAPPQQPSPASPSEGYQRPLFHVARHAARADVDALDRDLEQPVPPEINRPAIALRIVIVSLVAIIAGVITLLGGFERDPSAPSGPPAVSLGQKVAAGIWAVTVDKVTMGTSLHGKEADKGFLIEVDITLENHGDRTRYAYGVIKLVKPSVDKFDNGEFYLLRDDGLNPHSQPGITEKYAIIWEIPEGARPTELTLEIIGIHPREAFLGLLNDQYDDENVDAVMTVPVRSS